jgi:glycogen debranching enzyme
LDNFYSRQHNNGYICREIKEETGKDFAYGGWGNTINPPIFAWAEVESYRLTGDKSRFKMVLPVLEKYAEWLNRDGDPRAKNWRENGRMSHSAEHKLYWNTPLGSGMDNSPRPSGKGSGWVEMSCQMVIMYNNLAVMADELKEKKKAEKFRADAKAIAERINKWCWNEEDGFYYDVSGDGTQFKKMTMGGFWPLLAGIASKEQAERLVAHLKDEKKFWRKMVFPTLAADEEEYVPEGFYWRGGVWAPTNVMVIKGLERYGYEVFAALATEKYLFGMFEVFKTHKPKSVWEVYAPDFHTPAKGGRGSKPHFVGWSGCGPIQLLFENVMGIRPNGVDNTLAWQLRRTDRHGVEKLRVGDATLTLICEKRESAEAPAVITMESSKKFKVEIVHPNGSKTVKLKRGKKVTITVK